MKVCGYEAGEGEGYLGQSLPWSVFIQQSLSIKQRLCGQTTPTIAAKLAEAVVAVLQADGIAVPVEKIA